MFKKNEDAIRRRILAGGVRESAANIADATMQFIEEDESRANFSDSDDDVNELQNAEVEEAEDRIYRAYKEQPGRKMEDSEIRELARNADTSQMDQSILISAKQGGYAHIRKPSARNVRF